MTKQIDEPNAGGVVWRVDSNTHIKGGYYRDLDFDPYEKGLEVGRMTQPHDGAPIADEAERALGSRFEQNTAALAGRANSFYVAARETITRRPVDLNAEARLARTKTEFGALHTAVFERATPIAQRVNAALGERSYFQTRHRRGPLSESDYAIEATIVKPMGLACAAVGLDAVLNAVQYVAVMPDGALGALVIAWFAAASMGITGALGGNAMRYWFYATPSTRRMWRVAGIAATFLAIGIAFVFAQYRAVLEASAVSGADASLGAIFSTPPSIMSVTVAIGAAAVFLFTAFKFRGGAGSPWAAYGDHARVDREARRALKGLEEIKRYYFTEIRQIAADTLEGFEEVHEADRVMLDAAYTARDKTTLQIRDLLTSAHAYRKLVLGGIQGFRDGVMAVRPEVLPEQFRQLPELKVEGFPDPADLDAAIRETEGIFAARTQQLARLQSEVGNLELAAMNDFPLRIQEIRNAGEKQRLRDHKMKRLGDGEQGEALA